MGKIPLRGSLGRFKFSSMITKAEVIELYLSNKIETEKLLELMREVDSDDLHEDIIDLEKHLLMIDIIIDRINHDNPTQEELKHFLNAALIKGDSN